MAIRRLVQIGLEEFEGATNPFPDVGNHGPEKKKNLKQESSSIKQWCSSWTKDKDNCS